MPATRSVAFVPVILCLALHALPNELMAQQRAPVPDAQAEQAARKEAGEIYGGRFALAKTTAEKTALATEMIEAAGKLRDGAAGQYALLKVAVEIAAGAGDAPTALRAVEELVERFEVPGPKLAAETLLAAAGNATTSSQREAVGEAVLGIADAVADADEYALALKLCESARSFAQKAKQFPLAKDLTAKIEAIKRRQIAFQEYRAAWAVLDKSPTEPAANLATGRHLCFVKGDWDSGVPKLALGSDTALKDVAVKDLRGATSAEEQAAIGDAWWDLAETKQGSERDTLRLRAGFWYRQAAPKLAGGLTGLKTKERLAEVEKLGREMPAASQAATPAREPAPAMAPFDERAAKQHQMLWAKHLKVPAVQTNSLGMRMVLIPPGEFEMGSGQEEVTRLLEEAKQQNAPPWYGERVPAEAPKHRVKITKPFYLGICEVTQEQYLRLMGRNPSKFQSIPNRPVEQVDWSRCGGVLPQAQRSAPGEGRWRGLSAAHGGRVGICVPRGHDDSLQLRRCCSAAGCPCMVERELPGPDGAGGATSAQRLGTLRHARQRVGVVLGLARGQLLRRITKRRSDGTRIGRLARVARRGLGQHLSRSLPLRVPSLRRTRRPRPQLRFSRRQGGWALNCRFRFGRKLWPSSQ